MRTTPQPTHSRQKQLAHELLLVVYVVAAILVATPLGTLAHIASPGHGVDAGGHLVHVDDSASTASNEHGDIPCDDEKGQSDAHCHEHLGTLPHAVTPVAVACPAAYAAEHGVEAGRALEAHRDGALWRLAPKTSPPTA